MAAFGLCLLTPAPAFAATRGTLHFRLPAAGRYALLHASVTFPLGRGQPLPRVRKLALDTRSLPGRMVVVAHAYFSRVRRRTARGQLVLDLAVLNPKRISTRARPTEGDGLIGFFLDAIDPRPLPRGLTTANSAMLELFDTTATGCELADHDVQQVAGDLDPRGYDLALGETVVHIDPRKERDAIQETIDSMCAIQARAAAAAGALKRFADLILGEDDDLIAPPHVGAPAPPPIPHGQVGCREAADFVVPAPPPEGTEFVGPPVLPFPPPASTQRPLQTWLIDTNTGKPPVAEPWVGITWKVSYEGRSRQLMGTGWEYVLEFDRPAFDARALTPAFLVWRYGFLFAIKGHACPEYASEV